MMAANLQIQQQQLHEQQQQQNWAQQQQHRPSMGHQQLSGDGIQIVVNDVDHFDKPRSKQQQNQGMKIHKTLALALTF